MHDNHAALRSCYNLLLEELKNVLSSEFMLSSKYHEKSRKINKEKDNFDPFLVFHVPFMIFNEENTNLNSTIRLHGLT